MMARMGNKLIAICSAAIGIIYAAGYVVTESAAADTGQTEIAMAQLAPSSKPTTQPIQTQQTEPSSPQPTITPVNIKPTETVAPSQPAPTNQQLETTAPIATKAPRTPRKPAPVTAKPQLVEPLPTLTPSPSPQPTPLATPLARNQKYQDGTFTGSGTNRFGTVEVELTIKKGKIANVDITSSRTRYPEIYIEPLPAEVIDTQDYNIDTVSGATRSSEDFINAVRNALMQAEGNN